MRKTAIAITVVLVFLAATHAFAFLSVKADQQTIIVPDHYPTIMAAIENANNGDTIFIREGTYEGPISQTIVIDKTLSIVGENAEKTIVKLHPAWSSWWILTAEFFNYTDAITINADDSKLLNLTLIIASPGGYITATGKRIEIAGNNVTTGSSTGVSVNGFHCNITDNVMGGLIQLNGDFNEVARNALYSIYVEGSSNVIKDNSCQNLGLDNSTNNVVLGNRVATNSRSYSGISLSRSDNNFFFRNHVSGFSNGFRLWLSSNNTITANTVADSATGTIQLGGSSNNTFSLNNFVDNMYWYNAYYEDQYTDPNVRATFPNMTLSTNFWDNGMKGNHWGNYNGSDWNWDGVGDEPYVINANNQDHYPLMAMVDIESVPIQLPEWAMNRMPGSEEPKPQVTEPFPTLLFIIVMIIAIVAMGAGLLFYFKKRKSSTSTKV